MPDDDDFKPATGRWRRLGKLASLGARLSTEVVSKAAEKVTGLGTAQLSKDAAEKLVATLGEMKGLAMKFGQAVAMDPDLLTPEVRAVVARLQNQAPPMPYATVARVIEEELGKPPEAAFATFEKEPLASASLGQVHGATLSDGTEVAVKIQYPDIGKAVVSDLDNLGAMVSVVSRAPGMSVGRDYFKEVSHRLLEELDYREEAARAELFAKACEQIPTLHVPRVIHSHTAKRVLTLERVRGATLKELLNRIDTASNEERFAASRLLAHAMWGPFLAAGVIHGDPHPGNFILRGDGKMTVLDFGSVKSLSPEWVDVNRRMFDAALGGAEVDMLSLSREAGFEIELPDAEARAFLNEVVAIAERPIRSGRQFDFDKAGLNQAMKNHFLKANAKLLKLRPPPESVMFYRAMGGLIQNLENLKARGDFVGVYEELRPLYRAPPR